MANNLDFDIIARTDKARAELTLLQAELKKTAAELKKAGEAGDKTRVTALSSAYNTLQREIIQTSRAVTQQNRALVGHGLAAAGAARGLHALAGAHAEVGEASRVNVREISKISQELGNLEVTGFGVAKMFKEFPKIAVPVAIGAGVLAAARKLASATYTNVTALDDLSKASGFAGSQIIGLEHTFAKADVGATDLHKMILSVGESFDKAKIKAGDLGAMMYGVQTFRGPAGAAGGSGYGPGSRATQSTTPGLSDYEPPAPKGVGPGSGAFQQGVAVMRGNQPLNIDPSKGLAGLVDPNQFRTVEEFFTAARKALLNINEFSPLLAREILKGQGLEPVATLRGMLGSSAADFARVRDETLSDPRLREGLLPTARRFGAGAEQLGEGKERLETETGIGPMMGAARDMETINAALDKTSETIQQIREKTAGWIDDLKGADLSASAASWAQSWNTQISNVTSSYDAMIAHMNSQAGQVIPLAPAGGGSQEGQVIPLAPAGGMASGGYVRGPGTGTSDSILARLSAGEFVVNSASVRQVGLGFLRRLNGFADGGLVPSMAFASGGLVPSAGGGTPVHLHLGGQSFVTHATSSVAAALVSEAAHQQMRSAGTKPSWFGGRAGGH